MKIVILYSGGLDSFILKKYAENMYPYDEVKCLYYAHGAESESQEIKRLPSFVEVRKIDWLGDKIHPVAKLDDPFAGSIYIPGRNLVFSVLAASQELANEIWMGTVWDEDNPGATDKNETFRNDTGKLLTYVLSPFIKDVQIRFPFVELEWTKDHCVNWALKNGVLIESLKSTVSCWHHDGLPCGRCKQCFKRWFIFFLNGFEEKYKEEPIFSKYGKEMIKMYLDAWHSKTMNQDETEVAKNILLASTYLNFPQPMADYIQKILNDYN